MLILPAHLTVGGKEIPTYALTNTRAEGKAFIDKEWAKAHDISLLPLKKPFNLEVINRRSSKDAVTHYALVSCRINNHIQDTIIMFTT